MPKKRNMEGRIFGRLTIISFHDRQARGKAGTMFRRWKCLCECGSQIIAATGDLTSGNTKSCGCWKIETAKTRMTTHGQTSVPEYYIWQGMIARCTRPKHVAYPNYGGRGIKVCQAWRKFEVFLADMGKRPSEDHTIERRDNSGDYEPGNCVWVTQGEQNKNQRRRIDNTSGATGVVWNASRQKWEAFIGVNGRRVYLGLFDNIPEAASVRKEAMHQYGFNPSHGVTR